MENFGEKIGRKTFFDYVWLGGEEGKINDGTQMFSLQIHQKMGNY